MRSIRYFVLLLLFLPLAGTTADRLADLSLEQLANIEITSLGKKAAPLSQTPASLYVITASDIRRSGATTLPEALRLAPNLLVTQVDSYQYAISARGTNATISNKLQVLIDGRIVYTPFFSGVFWDAQEVPLEDVERIEVISGPEDASWGANSVNGVINVITKSSTDTQGGLARLDLGNEEQLVSLRHGGAISDATTYRVYGRTYRHDGTRRDTGADANDAWDRVQAGFRLDWSDADDSLRLQGDLYRSDIGDTTAANGEVDSRGANLTVEWGKGLDQAGRIRVLAYQDYTNRDFQSLFKDSIHTTFIEFQHTLNPIGRHNPNWGVDHRTAVDNVENEAGAALAFIPQDKTLHWTSIYGSDEIVLSDRLRLTVSGRVEHNSYTGTELMPSARLAWAFDDDQLLWAAASRAVRTPSRLDRDLFSPSGPPFLLVGSDFESELATVYQLGYRATLASRATINVTLFHSEYDKLRSVDLVSSQPTLYVIGNNVKGYIRGIEAWGNIQIQDDWRLNGGLVLQDDHFEIRDPTITGGPGGLNIEGNDPDLHWILKSEYDLDEDKEFDILLRHVSRLRNPDVSAFTEANVRFAWWVDPDLELSVTLKNLLDPNHVESGTAGERSEIDRSLNLGVRWSF